MVILTTARLNSLPQGKFKWKQFWLFYYFTWQNIFTDCSYISSKLGLIWTWRIRLEDRNLILVGLIWCLTCWPHAHTYYTRLTNPVEVCRNDCRQVEIYYLQVKTSTYFCPPPPVHSVGVAPCVWYLTWGTDSIIKIFIILLLMVIQTTAKLDSLPQGKFKWKQFWLFDKYLVPLREAFIIKNR